LFSYSPRRGTCLPGDPARVRTGVAVLSQYADESYAFELFRDGTAGLAYLLKDRIGDLSRLLDALREVSTGGSVIDP
jgi:DNA-binding NarL/FixJ family response regulator